VSTGEIFKLSPQQRRVRRLRPDPCKLYIRATGGVDIDRVGEALRKIVARHEILRTRIEERPGFLTGQVIEQPDSLAITRCSGDAELSAFLAAPDGGVRIGYAAVPGGVRVGLVMPGTHGDRGGVPVLLRELAATYSGAFLQPLDVQYADVAAWLDELPEDPSGEKDRAVWRRATGSNVLACRLPYEQHAEQESRPRYKSISTNIPCTQQADEECMLLGAWRRILCRLVGQDEITIGVRVTVRDDALLVNMLGPLGAMIAVRTRAAEAGPHMTDPDAVAFNAGKAEPYCHSWEDVGAGWSGDATPYIPFGFEYFEWPEPVRVGDVTFRLESCDGESERSVAVLRAHRQSDELLQAELVTDSRRIPEEFTPHLLSQFVENFTRRPAKQHRRAARDPDFYRSHSAIPYPVELIWQKIAAEPQRLAVIGEDLCLTYAELGERVRKLVAKLRAVGIAGESPVAVLLDRTAEAVVSCLAVITAGAVYAPLDPEDPDQRIAVMLRALRPGAVITTTARVGGMGLDMPVLAPDTGSLETCSPVIPAHPDPLGAVAIIHTSGTTATPKAVVLTQQGLRNRLAAEQRLDPIQREDRVLWTSGIAFDFSLITLLAPLSVGAAIVVPDGDVAVPAKVLSSIRLNRVSMAHFTPSKLAVTLATEDLSDCESLRRVHVGGEPLQPGTMSQMHAASGALVSNWYGPTEAHVDVTRWQTVPGRDSDTVPIGLPIENVSVYVLDADLQQAPVGCVGEIHIGGLGPARGYLGRPGETAERFVPDPYGDPGSRMYRTGDLGRRRWDEVIDFVGRADEQFSLRGFRIEPGEVDAALLRVPGAVAAACALVGSGTDTATLVAFLVMSEESDPRAVTAALAGELPRYMVPQRVVFVEALPLTRQGKINRQALSSWAVGGNSLDYAPPKGDLERALAMLWSRILSTGSFGVDQVSRHTDFYQLGGHSLVALQVLSFIHQVCGVDLSLKELLAARTVAELALTVTASEVISGQAERAAGLWLKVVHGAD
jgi:amino acid adenylation domain-containing protein